MPQSMMPKSVKRLSDDIMLQRPGIDHVYDFGSISIQNHRDLMAKA
jgi:hypothetical protein